MHQHPVLSTQACGQHGLQTIEHALSAAGTAAGQAFEMRWPTLQGPNVIVLRRQNQPTAADLRHLRQRLHAGNYILLKSRTQNNHAYYMYLVEVPFVPSLRAAFAKVLSFLRYKNVHRMYVEKTDIQYLTLEELAAVSKRSVFATTIAMHAGVLQRVSESTESWGQLCASLGTATPR